MKLKKKSRRTHIAFVEHGDERQRWRWAGPLRMYATDIYGQSAKRMHITHAGRLICLYAAHAGPTATSHTRDAFSMGASEAFLTVRPNVRQRDGNQRQRKHAIFFCLLLLLLLQFIQGITDAHTHSTQPDRQRYCVFADPLQDTDSRLERKPNEVLMTFNSEEIHRCAMCGGWPQRKAIW